MTKEFNKLDKTFNITPEVVEEEVTPMVEREKPDRLTKDDIEKDYEYTRGNLYEEEKAKGPNNVTNALFVGSTADLAKLIKQQNSKPD